MAYICEKLTGVFMVASPLTPGLAALDFTAAVLSFEYDLHRI